MHYNLQKKKRDNTKKIQFFYGLNDPFCVFFFVVNSIINYKWWWPEHWSSKAVFAIVFLAAVNIIKVTSKETFEETHKADRNPPITNFCFLRDPLRWLTAVKNANISWLLNFRIHVFLKSAVRGSLEKPRVGEIGILLKGFIGSFLIVK